MIESNIAVPSTLPDFEVPGSAPNYWQELAAYVWVSTLHNMESDGQKVRQEALIDDRSVEMAVHDLILPWFKEDENENAPLLEQNVTYLCDEIYYLNEEIKEMKTSVDTVKASVDAVKTSVDAVAYHTDAVSRKPGLNVDTPDLIDDFFSGIVVDSDAIKVAIVAIQSILEGGNLVLDLVAEAIKEQTTATEESSEVLQELSDRLFDEESDLSITETLTVTSEKLSISATETEPERSFSEILAAIEKRLFVEAVTIPGEEEPEKSVSEILNKVESYLHIPEKTIDNDGIAEIVPELSIAEVVQNLSVMPSELHLHVSNLNTKESQDYTERWSAS